MSGCFFHHAHQRWTEAVAAHHAVRVEHDHVAVVAAPSGGRSRRHCRPCDLVRSAGASGSRRVQRPRRRAARPVRRAVRPRRRSSAAADLRLAGVGKHVRRRRGAPRRSRRATRQVARRPAKTVAHVLVADRHHDRGACLRRRIGARARRPAPRARVGSPRSNARRKPISAVKKPAADPGEQAALNSADLRMTRQTRSLPFRTGSAWQHQRCAAPSGRHRRRAASRLTRRRCVAARSQAAGASAEARCSGAWSGMGARTGRCRPSDLRAAQETAPRSRRPSSCAAIGGALRAVWAVTVGATALVSPWAERAHSGWNDVMSMFRSRCMRAVFGERHATRWAACQISLPHDAQRSCATEREVAAALQVGREFVGVGLRPAAPLRVTTADDRGQLGVGGQRAPAPGRRSRRRELLVSFGPERRRSCGRCATAATQPFGGRCQRVALPAQAVQPQIERLPRRRQARRHPVRDDVVVRSRLGVGRLQQSRRGPAPQSPSGVDPDARAALVAALPVSS